MVSVVRLRAICRNSAWDRLFRFESSALVASSKIRIFGFLSTARAIANPLLFAAGKLEAALADRRLIPSGNEVTNS